MANLLNLVRQSTTTTGTGTISLDGSAVDGHRTWAGGGAVSGTAYRYAIRDGSAYEIGEGTYTSSTPDTLSRDTVLLSSNAGAAISLSGSAEVYCDAVVEDLVPGATDIDGLSDAVGPSTAGVQNYGFGAVMPNVTTGTSNLALGSDALVSVTSGGSNVAIGAGTASSNTTGSQNTLLGTIAGRDLGNPSNDFQTGSNCTIVGYNANASASGATNEITLGDANITSLRCNQTTISSLSDARDKANVTDLSLGLDYLEKVRPVEFDWQRRVPDANDGKHQAGFIAQELMAVEDEHDAAFLGSVLRSNPDKLEAGPAALIPVMVKAIQELSARVKELEGQING